MGKTMLIGFLIKSYNVVFMSSGFANEALQAEDEKSPYIVLLIKDGKIIRKSIQHFQDYSTAERSYLEFKRILTIIYGD